MSNPVAPRIWRRVRALVRRMVRRGGDAHRELAALQRAVDQRLRATEGAVVAVVETPSADSGFRDWLHAEHPSARVHLVDWSAGREDVHLRITALGPADLVVDRSRAARPVHRLTGLLFHVRSGGALIVCQPRASEPRARLERFSDRLARAIDRDDAEPPTPKSSDPRPQKEQDRDSLVDATRRVHRCDGLVVLESRAQALVKVRESQANRMLALRGGGQVLLSRPGCTLRSRSVVRASDPEWAQRLPTEYDVPELSLRAYRGVEVHPGQVLVQGNTVLPDTFRHNQAARLRNGWLAERGAEFVASPEPATRTLEGSWFHLDNEFRGHFGHMMTEQLSRLWGWPAAKSAYPDLKVLMTLNRAYPRNGGGVTEWEHALLEAAGIARSDVVMVSEPVRVETLVSATPMFSMPHYVHPAIEETWTTIGDRLVLGAPIHDRPDRLFSARREEFTRRCLNAADVVTRFAEDGFAVIHPEEHSLAEQAALFRTASVIAGFAGSNMFQTAFAGHGKHVILVTGDSYPGRNEFRIGAVLGHRIDVALCRSQVSPGRGRNSWDFRFDAAREGRFLDAVLGAL